MSSRIPGFYKKTPEERLSLVAEMCSLDRDEARALADTGGFPIEMADKMIENVIGGFVLPLGIATNFRVDGKDVLVPMAVEEPSVVAAASKAAKIALSGGGFFTRTGPQVMIGQIQLVDVVDAEAALSRLEKGKDEIIDKANRADPVLVGLGGGMIDVRHRTIDTLSGKMVVVHLLVNCLDAMGANAVNTMAEAVTPLIEELSGGRALLRILSNLAVYRLFRARAVFRKEVLGSSLVENIILAYHFAEADPFRAATHNKGIMNGISAVVRATGNDTRAIEAGAHAYASFGSGYKPLSVFHKDEDGSLVGEIELPLALGLVGGATRSHPQARACIKILGVKSAVELGAVTASVGLAQNFAALRALSDEGIQRGHMKLHARNVAVSAGAHGGMVEKVARKMVQGHEVNEKAACRILKEMTDGLKDTDTHL